MRIRNIWALFNKDLRDGLRNYHVILVVLTPIVLSLLFSNLYRDSKSKSMLPRVGVVGRMDHPLLDRLASETFGVKIQFCSTRAELDSKILEGEVGFGIQLPDLLDSAIRQGRRPKLTLIHPTGLSEYLVERMQTALEKEIRTFFHLSETPLPIDIEISPVGGKKEGDRSFSNDLFPMLVLMAMGMVGFLAMPISFVEEKEKRTLDALLLTPTSSNELIVGKNLFGLLLIVVCVGAMVLLGHRGEGNPLYFWAFVLLGSMFCLLIGLLVSLFAKSQAGVNAMGTSMFMIFQLVPNLSQTSEVMRMVAPVVPSTYIGRGLKKAMFLDLSRVDIHQDLAITFCLMLLAYLAVFLCLRYRRNLLS